MDLSCNKHIVHELKGTYENAHVDDPRVGYFLCFIDLRLFFNALSSSFALTEMVRDESRYSL
ncbi:MAG: hypothetical protein ACMUEM_03690 [Flavobacteriales bacterium AspAUS03]